MKSSRSLIFGLIMFLTFIFIAIIVFLKTSTLLSNQFFTILGTGTQDMAVIIASHIELTNEDVQDLKQMEYKDIVNHPVNKQLQRLRHLKVFKKSANCVYIATLLKPEDIKYYVRKENADYYRGKIGQPLDVMWLVDVCMGVNKTKQGNNKFQKYYKNDIERYSCYDEKELKILKNMRPTYLLTYDNRDGKTITAYAPIWTKEGNSIGMLGIDISIESFDSFKNKVFMYLLILLIITNLALVGVLAACYNKYMKLVNERMYCDPLTQTYNRRYLQELFYKDVVKGKSAGDFFSIMMLDIDYFKCINDTYGHAVGDECLVGIASSIKNTIEKRKGIVVRFGGEEFLISFYATSLQEINSIIEEILIEIRQLDLIEKGCQVTSSLGAHVVSSDEIDNKNINEFIKRADDNLYFAKNKGRDRHYLTKSDKLSCKEKLDLI